LDVAQRAVDSFTIVTGSLEGASSMLQATIAHHDVYCSMSNVYVYPAIDDVGLLGVEFGASSQLSRLGSFCRMGIRKAEIGSTRECNI
jgi:hypothetical protein